MFAIELRFQHDAENGEGRGAAEASGLIVIDAFAETFKVPLGFWDESDYRQSWRRAFEVLRGRFEG